MIEFPRRRRRFFYDNARLSKSLFGAIDFTYEKRISDALAEPGAKGTAIGRADEGDEVQEANERRWILTIYASLVAALNSTMNAVDFKVERINVIHLFY